jgi:large subunit ribosomal protein L25
VFDLAIDGKSEKVLVKDVQYDHLGAEVLHVDFARVSLDERVEVTVPLELRGTPKGEADGGVLQQLVAELEIECLVTDIPDAIRHNVSEMGLDTDLHVRDLQLPPGVKALQDEDLVLAQVREVKEEEVAPTEVAEGGEPEVIGRKPEEGEEGAAAEGEKK